MHIPQETQQKQQTGHRRTPLNAVQWIVLLICLLTIFGGGIFTYYHRVLSAGSGMTAARLEPIPHSRNGSHAQNMGTIARNSDELAAKPSLWPVYGEVTSGFGWRVSPWGGGSEFHQGIDIANGMGTPVVATADGRVTLSEWSEGYGNVVHIDHGNGMETIYGHNSQIVIKAGQSVNKGQIISYLGNTGKSTGPHVHYEVRVKGAAVDPLSFMIRY